MGVTTDLITNDTPMKRSSMVRHLQDFFPGLVAGLFLFGPGAVQAMPFQANGIKIGEVDQDSVLVWTRLTSVETGNYQLVSGSAPGMAGEVRVVLWPKENPGAVSTTSWEAVDRAADHTRQIVLNGLAANTAYDLRCESRAAGGGAVSSSVDGSFRTAPEAGHIRPVICTVVTGQGLDTVDSGANGHRAYLEMLNLDPDFFVHTGDVLYYDKNVGELSQSLSQARERWHRMFSLGYNLDFFRQVPSYFIKDDHDTLKNDCWPGQTYGSLTFGQGVQVFHEETPSGPVRFRTVRWGKDLQIWLSENREFRSPNTMSDGPTKTIWGSAQMAWFKASVQASDATFKLLVSPGAVVGPDKAGKSDNHANGAFKTEGDELRQFIAAQENMFVVCGDRHWQYASIDPVTEVREYCTGAINRAHALRGGDPGYDATLHSYFAVRGGFLSILVDRQADQPQVTFRWHDADAIDPDTGRFQITYEETLRPRGFGLVTLTSDHDSEHVTVRFMSRNGFQYRVETSTNLAEWDVLAEGLEARGALIEFNDENALSSGTRRFYRVEESPIEAPSSPLLFASGLNGSLIANSNIAGEDFNRADFIVDLLFTTPTDLGVDSDFLLFEAGGAARGTVVALQDGRLGITGGHDGESIVNYTGAAPLLPSTSYSLRIEAISSAGTFTAALWKQGEAAAASIVARSGLTLDGFAGSDDAGVGIANSQMFTAGLVLPATRAPAGMAISMKAYHPGAELPEQPAP